MKKLVAFIMLCSMCMVIMVSTSRPLYAVGSFSSYSVSNNGANGPGEPGGGEDIWSICKELGKKCLEWGICLFVDGLLKCVTDEGGTPDGSSEKTMIGCQCVNGEKCYSKCGICGTISEGSGPAVDMKHTCIPKAN